MVDGRVARFRSSAWPILALLMLSPLFLAACGGTFASPDGQVQQGAQVASGGVIVGSQDSQPTGGDTSGTAGQVVSTPSGFAIPTQTVVDDQGAVEVAVTPLPDRSDLNAGLVFQVAMNTHSVDLAMDLASLATLETDNGLVLPASAWSGGYGHHVTGYLEFALSSPEEAQLLVQARWWRIDIRNLDTPLRRFEWTAGGAS